MAHYDIGCTNPACGEVWEVKMSMNHTPEDVAELECPLCKNKGNKKLLTLNSGGVRCYGIGAYSPNQR